MSNYDGSSIGQVRVGPMSGLGSVAFGFGSQMQQIPEQETEYSDDEEIDELTQQFRKME